MKSTIKLHQLDAYRQVITRCYNSLDHEQDFQKLVNEKVKKEAVLYLIQSFALLFNSNYQTDVPILKLILSNVKALKKENSGLKSSVATFIDISKEYAKKEEQLTEEPIYVTMNSSSKPLEMNLDNRIVEAVIKAQQWEQLHIHLKSLGPQMVGQM